MDPLLQYVDAVTVPVPDLDRGMAFYRDVYEPDWKVASADAAAEVFAANGGRVLAGPMEIPIGRLAIVEDPFGNRLVLLDSTKGTYDIGESGEVTGVS